MLSVINLLLFTLLYYNMYKKWDIIIHNYECNKAVAVVIENPIRVWSWISTEFINHIGTTRSRWNTCNKYIFKPNQQYNIPKENITATIWFMDIEGKMIIWPEEDDIEDEAVAPVAEDD